mgnify:CR=1 FL=1
MYTSHPSSFDRNSSLFGLDIRTGVACTQRLVPARLNRVHKHADTCDQHRQPPERGSTGSSLSPGSRRSIAHLHRDQKDVMQSRHDAGPGWCMESVTRCRSWLMKLLAQSITETGPIFRPFRA